MGKTAYHAAMDAVIDHYLDRGPPRPALVVFQTDGGPINKLAAERYLCKAARLPLFWQFVGFGNTRSTQFDFLRRLDELPVPAKRVVDNAGYFHAGPDPRAVPDWSCTTGWSRSSRLAGGRPRGGHRARLTRRLSVPGALMDV